LLFKYYTKKQWDKYPNELNASVLERIPVRSNTDDRYFTDTYQALPKDGYTSWFEHMLGNRKISIQLKLDYFKLQLSNNSAQARNQYEVTFFTGPIDNFFEKHNMSMLEYRSLQFHKEYQSLKTGHLYQPTTQVNYPTADTNYTRTVEYVQLPNQTPVYNTSSSNVFTMVVFHETSSDKGEPYYPVPNRRNLDLYAKYQTLASKVQDVIFVGRLASYKYFDMDDATRNALNTFRTWVSTAPSKFGCNPSVGPEFYDM
jgi:UDP-galactopyranose mutase